MEMKTKLFFSRDKILPPISVLVMMVCFLLAVFLQGCASSNLSRGAAGDIHDAYQNVSDSVDSNGVSVTEAYQGTSQTTKGMMLGAPTGAVASSVMFGSSAIFPGAIGGAIFGGALGRYIDDNTTLEDKIVNRGNKVIILGDQILIVLPSKYVFVDDTPELQPFSYKTLDLVAQMISSYPNMSVKVASYTTSTLPDRINLSLSQEQANSVVKYLWRTHINTRMLYADGGGASKPIAEGDSDTNNRVEITLEKLPV